MRLSELELWNYRSCYRTTVRFAEHLTLIVGENDAGKSNIIDALRVTIPTEADGQQSGLTRTGISVMTSSRRRLSKFNGYLRT